MAKLRLIWTNEYGASEIKDFDSLSDAFTFALVQMWSKQARHWRLYLVNWDGWEETGLEPIAQSPSWADKYSTPL